MSKLLFRAAGACTATPAQGNLSTLSQVLRSQNTSPSRNGKQQQPNCEAKGEAKNATAWFLCSERRNLGTGILPDEAYL